MELMAQLDAVDQQARQNFAMLSSEQLNWKPSLEKWSIAQCLDQLMVSNTTYFPIFEQMIKGIYQPSLGVRINPLKKFFGRMGIKTLGPTPSKKFKNPQIFEPSSSNIPPTIVQEFSHHQDTLKFYFKQLQNLNTNKIFMASPVSPIISYSLKDAMAILAGHEQRHINQAMEVLHHPNFPK